jgi:cell division septum initiation protein DivIVA
MSHFYSQRPDLSPPSTADSVRSPFADVAGRFANWLAGVERGGEEMREPAEPGSDPHDVVSPETRALRPGADPEPAGEHPGLIASPTASEETAARFPVAPLGYNRGAVDEHVTRLEHEVGQLRAELGQLRAVREPSMSITEELEWIGEQTASILVVAHDKAHETTRRAQEQAERAVSEAAANAMAVTEEARRRLSELDTETEQVWRERERLLDDVRIVSAALAELADEASGRFPAAEDAAAAVMAAGTSPARATATMAFDALRESGQRGEDPQPTQPFSALEAAQASGSEEPHHEGPLGDELASPPEFGM